MLRNKMAAGVLDPLHVKDGITDKSYSMPARKTRPSNKASTIASPS